MQSLIPKIVAQQLICPKAPIVFQTLTTNLNNG